MIFPDLQIRDRLEEIWQRISGLGFHLELVEESLNDSLMTSRLDIASSFGSLSLHFLNVCVGRCDFRGEILICRYANVVLEMNLCFVPVVATYGSPGICRILSDRYPLKLTGAWPLFPGV